MGKLEKGGEARTPHALMHAWDTLVGWWTARWTSTARGWTTPWTTRDDLHETLRRFHAVVEADRDALAQFLHDVQLGTDGLRAKTPLLEIWQLYLLATGPLPSLTITRCTEDLVHLRPALGAHLYHDAVRLLETSATLPRLQRALAEDMRRGEAGALWRDYQAWESVDQRLAFSPPSPSSPLPPSSSPPAPPPPEDAIIRHKEAGGTLTQQWEAFVRVTAVDVKCDAFLDTCADIQARIAAVLEGIHGAMEKPPTAWPHLPIPRLSRHRS
jgi:hypothetical protein